MKGGYQIIDFRGVDFTVGTATKVDGVYERIEGNYNKALLIENFSIGGVEQNATWVVETTNSANYVLIGLSGYNITVTNADNVTVTAITSGGES